MDISKPDHNPTDEVSEFLDIRPDRRESEKLLAEVSEVIRMAPTVTKFAQPEGETEHIEWLGRASAVIQKWKAEEFVILDGLRNKLLSRVPHICTGALDILLCILNEAKYDLALECDQSNLVIPRGHVHNYYDELRKLMESAGSDVFCIDPYLDADFVQDYLHHVKPGVSIRLLGGPERQKTLRPAVKYFKKQTKQSIDVRISGHFHDRFVFLDKHMCYFSGASFKDGARKSPTILGQIFDIGEVILNTYQKIWDDTSTSNEE